MATNQEYAYLAEDAYKTLEPGIRDLKKLKPRVVGGREYFVLEHADYRGTHDYQGTIYMDAQTHEIIVAHRGTWSVSDVGVDLEMIRRQSNRQLPHAMALVEHAKALAREWNADNPNEQVPNISVTGHSLGGTLAQATAYQYGLHGVTFNAYGAAELPGIPHNESTNQVINYVRATDVVSAGARHFGNTTILTTQKDIDMLNSYGYDNPANTRHNINAALHFSGASHSITNFTGSASMLSNEHEFKKLTHQHSEMIHQFREDIHHAKDRIHKIPAPRLLIAETDETLKTTLTNEYVQATTPTIDNPMLQALLQNPAFAALSPEQQTALIAGAGGQVSNLVTPSFDAPNINNATAASVNESIDLPPRVASLREQITEKFGDQIAHLSEKDQQTTIALATREAMSFYARTVDYVFVNQQGDVCISFDGDKGFSGDVNLNQVHHQDANQVLLASIDKQQSQLQELSMQRAQSQNQSPTMSI